MREPPLLTEDPPHMTNLSQVNHIIDQACAGTSLHDWRVMVTIDPDLTDAASIEADHDLKRARMRVHPEYQRLVPGTLDELVAHELGHLLTDDVFRFLKPTPATREAEERIATRIGLLLLKR